MENVKIKHLYCLSSQNRNELINQTKNVKFWWLLFFPLYYKLTTQIYSTF